MSKPQQTPTDIASAMTRKEAIAEATTAAMLVLIAHSKSYDIFRHMQTGMPTEEKSAINEELDILFDMAGKLWF